MKLTHLSVSLDLYCIIFYYHAVMNIFIQWQKTISDTYLTYTPPCFPFIEPNVSLLPQGSLASIPSNALIFVNNRDSLEDNKTTFAQRGPTLCSKTVSCIKRSAKNCLTTSCIITPVFFLLRNRWTFSVFRLCTIIAPDLSILDHFCENFA